MSTFSGKQGKGAMRTHRQGLTLEAYFRAFQRWHNGSGRVIKPNGVWELATHPYTCLPKACRPTDVKSWPVRDDDFPDGLAIRTMVQIR